MAHALASLETIFSFVLAGVDQAYYFTDPTFGGATTNPTYKTFEFLKTHLGSVLLKSYPTDSTTFKYHDYRGYVAQDNDGTITLWGLSWGDITTTVNVQVDNLSPLYTYTLTGCHKLIAPSLLHGALGDENAPPLSQELQITFTPD